MAEAPHQCKFRILSCSQTGSKMAFWRTSPRRYQNSLRQNEAKFGQSQTKDAENVHWNSGQRNRTLIWSLILRFSSWCACLSGAPMTQGTKHWSAMCAHMRRSIFQLFSWNIIHRYTILFSHGNASDLGQGAGYLLQLGYFLQCNVLAYDYSGYGESVGKASAKNIHADAEAAYAGEKGRPSSWNRAEYKLQWNEWSSMFCLIEDCSTGERAWLSLPTLSRRSQHYFQSLHSPSKSVERERG